MDGSPRAAGKGKASLLLPDAQGKKLSPSIPDLRRQEADEERMKEREVP